MPETDPLRFGIVGCGVIGPVHAEAIASLPDAQLVAVTDLVLERAQTLAGRYDATPYTDLATMLERERLDVVIICTLIRKEQPCRTLPLAPYYSAKQPSTS